MDHKYTTKLIGSSGQNIATIYPEYPIQLGDTLRIVQRNSSTSYRILEIQRIFPAGDPDDLNFTEYAEATVKAKP